jgi:hypothetical protein
MPRRPNQAQLNALSENKREAYYNLTRNNGLPSTAAYNIVVSNTINRARLARFRNLLTQNKSDPLGAWNRSRAAPDPSNIHNNRALKSTILKSFGIPNSVVNSILASNNISNARMNRFFTLAFGRGESWNRAWVASAAGSSPTHIRRGHGANSTFVPTMALLRQKAQG